MASLALVFDILAKDNASRVFDKVGDSAERGSRKTGGLGDSMGKLAKLAGGAALAGIGGLGAAMFQGVKDAASYQQITDQLAQTLKSTGGAAGVSVEGLKQYAGQLESVSGVDEELILSSQNVLATFTNLRDGVGAGNKIFSQASQAALNLSTTMGGDLQGATVMVGKALNDPLKGITALSRAGVQLTQSQKDTIATMVASGDTMGAQKIILGELETQFGGAAAAAGKGLTGSLARAKDAFSDTFREIGTKLLPALATAAEWFAAHLPGAMATAGGALKDIGGAVSSVTTFFREHETTLKVVAGTVVTALTAMGVAATVNAAKSVVAWFAVATTATVGGEASKKSAAQVVVGWTVMAAKAMASAVRIAAAWLISLGPIALVIAAVAGLVVVVVKNWDKIKEVIGAGWTWVKDKTTAAWNGITDFLSGAWDALTGMFKAGWDGMKMLAGDALRFVVDKFLGMVEAIVGAAAKAFGWVPGIGGKLKAAAVEVTKFRDDTNRALGGIKDKTINVTTIRTEIQRTIVEGQRAAGRGSIPGFASGVRNFAGGWAMLGELGPELAYLPPGSNVYSATETERMRRGGGGGGGNTYVYNVSTAATDPAATAQYLRRLELLSG